MNRIGKTLLSIAALGLSFSVHAITPGNYESIVERNIFRLNPVPIVAPTTNTDPTLNREVKLSGISNIGGKKSAWFIIPTKPPSKDPPLYLNLSETEKADFLEVVRINEEEGEVKILHTGNAMTLTLKNDLQKLNPVAAAPAPVPVANVVAPQPAVTADANTASTYSSARTATVVGGTPALPTPAGQTADNGMRSIPTRTLRLAPVATQSIVNEKPVDAVTQRVMMEVDHADKVKKGLNTPPLPPLP